MRSLRSSWCVFRVSMLPYGFVRLWRCVRDRSLWAQVKLQSKLKGHSWDELKGQVRGLRLCESERSRVVRKQNIPATAMDLPFVMQMHDHTQVMSPNGLLPPISGSPLAPPSAADASDFLGDYGEPREKSGLMSPSGLGRV